MSDVTVLHEDFRALGYCNAGCRRWFEQRGLDWRGMCLHGMPAAVLLAFDDAQAARVVERAEKRTRGEI